ncbi:MAG: discoidin domain-containing protein [Chitinophagaceae bacterium]
MKFKLFIIFFLINHQISAQEKNVALNKPVIANSVNGNYPARNVVDGKVTRQSKWMSQNVTPPNILELDLQKYCNISRIVVHTGIPQAELTASELSQAPGFFSAKNFKLQYWDDANWTDIPNTEVHENRLTIVPYTFTPLLNCSRIRFVCDDGEPISIMEIEVFGTETNRVVAGSTTSLQQKNERLTDQQLTITVRDKVVGKTMKYVGYNQGYYMPGSNASGWIAYSGVNSLRVWTSLNSYVPLTAIQVDKSITGAVEFDKRKESLRSDPEKNEFIKWNLLLPLFEDTEKVKSTNPMVLSYVLSELKRLKVDPVLQINNTDFNETWSNKWQQWQRYYALAYYAAKTGDVTMFAMQNEPNHRASGPMKLDQWISGMQIVSDALKSAVEDVNKRYNKRLKARMLGPVTAGNNPEWWAAVAKSMRTDYHGKPVDEDLLGMFSTHSYNSPAAGYESRVSNISKLLSENQPGGKALPVVYTEIGRWMNAYLIDKEETMDSPSLFTEWAGIYTNNTNNAAYGMWAFKFSNTVSETYISGVKSGHHLTWQGKRIVEDAYVNLAKNKPVTASSETTVQPLKFIVDGDKSDRSAWYSDSGAQQKWIEIDLGAATSLGSAVIYTGSASGLYTAPDRVKNFSLQYLEKSEWKKIPGFEEKSNKYAQVFKIFGKTVVTNKIRFVTNDTGIVKVREIKLFGINGPEKAIPSFNVSGIQRTGEVVRLFAKGFKNERPLFETAISVKDDNLDALCSFDENSDNYYVWLVQRGQYNDHIQLDLSSLNINAGSPVTIETVGPLHFGEVTRLINTPANKKLRFTLSPQAVTLLTIARGKLGKSSIFSSNDATVSAGSNALKNYGQGQLSVGLDASKPANNKVSYIHFDLPLKTAQAQRIILTVRGKVDKGNQPYRLHVYGIPSEQFDERKLNWKNALLLDDKEALVEEVGQHAFIAGEIALYTIEEEHMLDVTDLITKHAGKGITFVFVRETRQLGDNEDKGRNGIIQSSESTSKPKLELWFAN